MTARLPADAGRSLGRLVVAVLELLQEVIERQAIRRMASLSTEEVERLGLALIAVRLQFAELRAVLEPPPDERIVP